MGTTYSYQTNSTSDLVYQSSTMGMNQYFIGVQSGTTSAVISKSTTLSTINRCMSV